MTQNSPWTQPPSPADVEAATEGRNPAPPNPFDLVLEILEHSAGRTHLPHGAEAEIAMLKALRAFRRQYPGDFITKFSSCFGIILGTIIEDFFDLPEDTKAGARAEIVDLVRLYLEPLEDPND